MAACILAEAPLDHGTGTLREVALAQVNTAWDMSVVTVGLAGATGGAPGLGCEPGARAFSTAMK